MPIEDAIKGTVDRRTQLKRGLQSLAMQITRLETRRAVLQAEFTKLDIGIDDLAAELKIPIDKEPTDEVQVDVK